MMNVSFSGLKGLSSNSNANILRNMGQDFKEGFTTNAKDTFKFINDLSGKKDVFIKLDEYSRNAGSKKKMYTIYLLDDKFKNVAKTSMIYYGTGFGEENIENCTQALKILKNEFLVNFPSKQAQKDVEYMINTYV